MVRLASGDLVVANAGSWELLYYQPRNGHVATAGGHGGGPSEFEELGAVDRLGSDTVIAYDEGRAALSVFRGRGEFVESIGLTSDALIGAAEDFVGVSATGVAYFATEEFYSPASADGINVDSVRVVSRPVAEASLDTLGVFPGGETHVETGIGGNRSVQTVRRPFTGRVRVAVGDSTVAVASADSFIVNLYRRGRKIHEIRDRSFRREQVTDEDRERWVDHWAARAGGGEEKRQALERMLRGVQFAREMPAVGGLLVDEAERVWIQEYAPPYSERDRRWIVVSPREGVLGSVSFPAGFTPTFVDRRGRVFGVSTNALGVESVEGYRLIG